MQTHDDVPPRVELHVNDEGVGTITFDGIAQRGVYKAELVSQAGERPLLRLSQWCLEISATVEGGPVVERVTVCPNCKAQPGFTSPEEAAYNAVALFGMADIELGHRLPWKSLSDTERAAVRHRASDLVVTIRQLLQLRGL